MNIHEGAAGGSSSDDAVAAVVGTPSTAEMLDGPLDEVDDDPEYQVCNHPRGFVPQDKFKCSLGTSPISLWPAR